jgi:hypothetical protein
MKAVVGDGAGQPQASRQAAGLNLQHLHVGHLVGRNGEQLGGVGVVRLFLGGVAGPSTAAAGKQQHDR